LTQGPVNLYLEPSGKEVMESNSGNVETRLAPSTGRFSVESVDLPPVRWTKLLRNYNHTLAGPSKITVQIKDFETAV